MDPLRCVIVQDDEEGLFERTNPRSHIGLDLYYLGALTQIFLDIEKSVHSNYSLRNFCSILNEITKEMGEFIPSINEASRRGVMAFSNMRRRGKR